MKADQKQHPTSDAHRTNVSVLKTIINDNFMPPNAAQYMLMRDRPLSDIIPESFIYLIFFWVAVTANRKQRQERSTNPVIPLVYTLATTAA